MSIVLVMELTSEQIQQLLIEKITGIISKDDDLAIEQLLAGNSAVFLQWQAMQQQLQGAQEKGFSADVDVEQKWQQMAPLLERQPRRVLSLKKVVTATAMLAALFAGVYLFYNSGAPAPALMKPHVSAVQHGVVLSGDNGKNIYLKSGRYAFRFGAAVIRTDKGALSYTYPQTAAQQWSTLLVPAVLSYKVNLCDGTAVWLNAETKLRFPFSFPGKTRDVYIDGEAYFEVAKNTPQPFVVHTHQTAIRVHGTRFNVNTYDEDRIKTALVEGAVTTTANHKEINLKPGFQAVYDRQHPGFKVMSIDQAEVLSWMKGIYYFHNTPLIDLSKLLSRWYDVTIQFDNPSLQHKTFSGELVKSQSIHVFLDNLKMSNNLYAEVKGSTVHFK